jgi:hypothetical protein
LAAGSRRVPLYAPRPGWGEGVTFAARRGREVALWGLTCGYFRSLGLKIKTRFYAGNLVSQGPSGTYGVGWMRRPYRYRQPWAGYPMGCHIGRLTRHENWRDLRRPLKFPNLIVSLTRFGHVIEGNVGPLFSIFVRPRRLVIEIGQIWGWVIRPVSPSTVTHPLGWW